MDKYTIVQVGLGARGETALKSFQALSGRLEIVGICDLMPERLRDVGDRLGIAAEKRFAAVEDMLSVCRPDLFSFCTLPSTRLELIEQAARHGVQGILFEKPMATSLAEARRIVDVCRERGIKAAVCHQHKYFEGFQRLKAMVDRGELGAIQRITAECQPWFSQLGTHYIDYAIWANGGNLPVAAVGHVHGRDLLTDSHPSPDYMLGEIVFGNGVRATVQFGYLSRAHCVHDEDYRQRRFPIEFWEDDRLTVYGETGYAWAECNGRWGAFTKDTGGKIISGCGNAFREEMEHPKAQMAYTEEFLHWMDGVQQGHSCDVATAYAGFETGVALSLSALENRRVDLPLKTLPQGDEIEIMSRVLPECPRRRFDGQWPE